MRQMTVGSKTSTFRAFGHYVFGTLGNEANVLLQYITRCYLVPCRLSSDPKYVTLNDLEWLEWPFFIKFSLLQTDCESYYLLIYCRVCLYTHVTSGDARKQSSGS